MNRESGGLPIKGTQESGIELLHAQSSLEGWTCDEPATFLEDLSTFSEFTYHVSKVRKYQITGGIVRDYYSVEELLDDLNVESEQDRALIIPNKQSEHTPGPSCCDSTTHITQVE